MSNLKPLPPRPKHPGRYGVSDVLGYLKELEKWAILAEERLVLRGEVEEDADKDRMG